MTCHHSPDSAQLSGSPEPNDASLFGVSFENTLNKEGWENVMRSVNRVLGSLSVLLVLNPNTSLSDPPDRPLALDICYVVEQIGNPAPAQRICNQENESEFRQFRNQGVRCARSAEWFMFNRNGQAAMNRMNQLTGIEAFPDVHIHYEAFEGTYTPRRIEVIFQGPQGLIEFELDGDCSLRALNREIPRHISTYESRLRSPASRTVQTR